MDRGKNPSFSIPHSCVDFTVAVLGNTTSAPTIPADGRFLPTTATYPRRANGVSLVAAEIPTRTSAGIYTVTIKHALVNILFATATVHSAGASPTAVLDALVTIINPATRVLTVKVQTPSGTLTDLGTSDMLVIYCYAQDSNA